MREKGVGSMLIKCMYGEECVARTIGWRGIPRVGEGVMGNDGVQYWVKGVYWDAPVKNMGQAIKIILTANAPMERI